MVWQLLLLWLTLPSTMKPMYGTSIHLSVEDSQGVLDTAFVEVFPVASNLNLATSPTGLQVTLDEVPFPAPYGTEAVSRDA